MLDPLVLGLMTLWKLTSVDFLINVLFTQEGL